MGRSPCCDKLGLKKGPWTPEEDQKLLAYIEEHGHGNWRALPIKAGLQRCGKSCRLRWTNYLRPDIKRGKFSLQEEQTIIQLHALLGNRWSAIATHLPKRTDNEIKNYWNTHLKKRLTKMGIDPVTHKPKNDALVSNGEGPQHTKNTANLSHMAQWESARLEAEARLARQSKLRSTAHNQMSEPHQHQQQQQHHEMNNFSNSSSGTSSTSTIATQPPRCLDVLKAWYSVWPSTSTTTTTTTVTPQGGIGIGVVGTANNANAHHQGDGGVGVRVSSPTSTLSFTETGPCVLAVGTTTTGGAVIEFMDHNGGQNNSNQVDQGLVKEEGEQSYYLSKGYDNHHHQNHIHKYHTRHDPLADNSLSFSTSSGGLNDIAISIEADNDEDDQDDDDEEEDDHDDQSFMEGFTELLLNNVAANTTSMTTNTSGNKSLAEGEGAETNVHNDNHGNSSSGSDYYEDNKNYWNSILNLVNSSPSESPMF